MCSPNTNQRATLNTLKRRRSRLITNQTTPNNHHRNATDSNLALVPIPVVESPNRSHNVYHAYPQTTSINYNPNLQYVGMSQNQNQQLPYVSTPFNYPNHYNQFQNPVAIIPPNAQSPAAVPNTFPANHQISLQPLPHNHCMFSPAYNVSIHVHATPTPLDSNRYHNNNHCNTTLLSPSATHNYVYQTPITQVLNHSYSSTTPSQTNPPSTPKLTSLPPSIPVSFGTAPIPGPLPTVPPLPGNIGTKLISAETQSQARTRVFSAEYTFGDEAIREARKGLSRVILTSDAKDIDLFAHQLRTNDHRACDPSHIKEKEVFHMAISYIPTTTQDSNSFDFCSSQWENFKAALQQLYSSGVNYVRVWLPPCLRICDESPSSVVHERLIPFIIWPVLSLGVKVVDRDRTFASFQRASNFLEELSALWSIGLIVTQEQTSRNKDFVKRKVSYNIRERLEPEQSLLHMFHHIYHGAIDDMISSQDEQMQELKSLALIHVGYKLDKVVIGSDWRSRVGGMTPKSGHEIVNSLQLEGHDDSITNSHIYLEGSRSVAKNGDDGWHGVKEFMSGNEPLVRFTKEDFEKLEMEMKKVNVFTNKGEFQILGYCNGSRSLWLLVAMDGFSADFSRGRVAWTKIIHGECSRDLHQAIETGNSGAIKMVLDEQNYCKDFAVNNIYYQHHRSIEWVRDKSVKCILSPW